MKKVILVAVIILIAIIAYVLGNKIPLNKVETNSGWRLEQLNGVIQKDSVVIVDEKANTIIINGSLDDKVNQIPIKEGRITFYEDKQIITDDLVWIYVPERGNDSVLKIDNFSFQCDEKMSDLTDGKTTKIINEYIVVK